MPRRKGKRTPEKGGDASGKKDSGKKKRDEGEARRRDGEKLQEERGASSPAAASRDSSVAPSSGEPGGDEGDSPLDDSGPKSEQPEPGVGVPDGESVDGPSDEEIRMAAEEAEANENYARELATALGSNREFRGFFDIFPRGPVRRRLGKEGRNLTAHLGKLQAAGKKEVSLQEKVRLTNALRTWTAHLTHARNEARRSQELDELMARMNLEEFNLHLNQFERRAGDALPEVQLHGGGLPGGVIEIIEGFYDKKFELGGKLDRLALDADGEVADSDGLELILKKLVDDEENKIRKTEASSSARGARKFYKADYATQERARQVLREKFGPIADAMAKKRGVTPGEPNKLRSWHLNDTGRLSRKILRGGTGNKPLNIGQGFEVSKPVEINSSWSPARRQLHAQWLKDVELQAGFQPGYVKDFPRGADAFYEAIKQQAPGYIEINPAGWRQANDQGRLIYDYIEDQWFLTTDHYHDAFWKIEVPREVRDNLQDKSRGAALAEDDPLYRVNNCLLDALTNAANQAGVAYTVPVTPNAIRDDLEEEELGYVGEMLFADQLVVERIMAHLNLANVPVVLVDETGQYMEIGGGGGGQVLTIYHTGALHYTAQPTTGAQVRAAQTAEAEIRERAHGEGEEEAG